MFVCLHTCLSSIIRYYVSRPLSISLFPSLSLCVCVCLSLYTSACLSVCRALPLCILPCSLHIHPPIYPSIEYGNEYLSNNQQNIKNLQEIHPPIYPSTEYGNATLSNKQQNNTSTPSKNAFLFYFQIPPYGAIVTVKRITATSSSSSPLLSSSLPPGRTRDSRRLYSLLDKLPTP